MSKGQRGNKEAKKPKKAQPSVPLIPAAIVPGLPAAREDGGKRK